MSRQCPNIHRAADGSPLDAPVLKEIVAPSGKPVALQCPVCLRSYCLRPGFREMLELCAEGIRVEQVMRYFSCSKARALRIMRQFERGRYVVLKTTKEPGAGKRKRTVHTWTARRTAEVGK